MSLSKLTIRSRPLPADDTIGSGGINLSVTTEQLFLIAALVSHCRLGQGSPYSKAAYELISLLENEFGSDFTSDACDDVNLEATIEDSSGTLVVKADSSYYITLEV